jgi:hypothetical protein
MPEHRLNRARQAYRNEPRYSQYDIERILRIKAIYQLREKYDSGAISWVTLKVRDVRHTLDGLVIEVE